MTAPGTSRELARNKKAAVEQMLDHLENYVQKKLPPLVVMLVQGCKGEMANLIRKDIAAIRTLTKRISSDVTQWGGTTDKLRFQNLMHSFDAQMRSAELRQQDKERRRFSRLALDLPLTVKQERSSHLGRAVNMNMEGMKVRSNAAHRVGDTVQVDVDEGLALRRVKGKVVWSRDSEGGGYEAGVKFLAMEAEMKEAIRRFLTDEADKRQPCQPGPGEVKKA
jgi:hypothetical protein